MMKRLNSNFALVCGFILMLIIVLVIVITTEQVKYNLDKIENEDMALNDYAKQMKIDVIQVQQWLTDISATRGQDGLDDGFDEAQASATSFLNNLDKFKEYYNKNSDENTLAELENIRNKFIDYHNQGKTMAQAYIDGGPEEGNKIMADFDEAAVSLSDAINPFIDEQLNRFGIKVHNVNFLLGFLVIISISTSVIIIIFGVVSSRITKKLQNKSSEKDILDLENLYSEIEFFTDSIIQGELDYRANEEKFEGKYKKIISGVNSTLNTLVSHINKIPLPFMIIDNNFNIKYINLVGAKILNKVTEEIKGTKCYELFKTGHCNTDNCACALAMKKDSLIEKETVAKPSGNDIYISYLGVPIKNKNNSIVGALEIIVDNTDMKKTGKKLLKQFNYQEKEVEKLINNLLKISKGDFNITTSNEVFDSDTEDIGKNFAKINDTLDTIAKNLSNVLFEIKQSSEQVSLSSNDLSSASQSLAQSSTQQASSIQEVTSSMELISEKTEDNAINASNASSLVEEVNNKANYGKEQMDTLLGAMNNINDSSSSISKIIKVIDEIAFQTNILALNAAVEAARAGQHGKGFAVVAEEVRNLASRSSEAANDTTELIENSIKKVEYGTKISTSTAKAFEEILDGINKTSKIVKDIAAASNDQSAGILEINRALKQIADTIQTNSSTAEEGAASSEELSSQAQLLKEMVNKFNLKKDFYDYNRKDENINIKNVLKNVKIETINSVDNKL